MALETPGGLKVQTVHGFCTRLLQQFPFEANTAARFEVLDEASQAQLLIETSLGVLLEAAKTPGSPLGRALATAISVAADRTFKEVVAEAIRKRDLVRNWIDAAGSMEAAIAALSRSLGIATDDTIAAVEREMTEGALLPVTQWAAVADILAQGSTSDQEQAGRLKRALAANGVQRTQRYLEFFFTAQLEPRQRLTTRAIADRLLVEQLNAECKRLMDLVERRKAIACRERTAALLTIADAVISRYQTAKDRRGLLDYDDLIDKTLMLLGEQRAAWVHYKLDRGIDHLLIDEAQDTSPKQWEIVRRLTAEFFAGAGARQLTRTMFAVGDEKQSIFSFQDAAPRAFAQMRRYFQSAHAAIGSPFVHLEFKHSFRSGPNVLAAVDEVFAHGDISLSVVSDSDCVPPHIALPDAAPGLVEIWDTTKPEDKREIEAWDAPFDELTELSPQVRLATRIARNIRSWMRAGARAGGVLVLVRQRGPLFEAIIRALKDLQIPVAGADRLVLTEHIAVMDLMALADALLMPDDDLALAAVLKSPLFGLNDDDLFEFAWQRKGSLRTALKAQASMQARFADAAGKLDRLAQWARSDPPFGFYARVLGAERGRRQFLARLGHEVDDALDEFLNLALDYERRQTPSLQGFIAWLRTTQTDVKRDMEITRDEVRVMTVHGAKGLEAPIVVLADTMTPPAGPSQRQPRVLALDDGHPPAEVGCFRLRPLNEGGFVWATARAGDVAPVAAARERARREAEDEYRRLLYVAMTRTIDRLIVCGAAGERAAPEGCWWNLVSAALKPVAVEEPADDGEGVVWRYRKTPAGAAAPTISGSAAGSRDLARPAWLERAAPAAAVPLQPLSPSRAYDEAAAPRVRTPGNRLEREQALARGAIVHRLLQSLPDIAPAQRSEAARHHLARTGAGFDAAEREAMLAQVRAVLDDPRFAALFANGSRAEVPIVGRLEWHGRSIAVSGQVDRLAVTGDAVLIADYKTNRPVPRTVAAVPPPYVAQLALYRAVLAQLFPGKTIRTVLLWTDVPDLMEIPAPALDQALVDLHG